MLYISSRKTLEVTDEAGDLRHHRGHDVVIVMNIMV